MLVSPTLPLVREKVDSVSIHLTQEKGDLMTTEIPESVRDVSLAGVGALLYTAASPDIYDGFSDEEFEQLKLYGPSVFRLYELVARTPAIPENLRFPEGFANHFEREVVVDLEIIRRDADKRDEFRAAMRELLSDKSQVKHLYQNGGTTYSKILSRVAGTSRDSSYYSTATNTSNASDEGVAFVHYKRRKRGKGAPTTPKGVGG